MRAQWTGRFTENRRMLLLLILIAGILFFGSILFILSRVRS